jgi:hypothetical protein
MVGRASSLQLIGAGEALLRVSILRNSVIEDKVGNSRSVAVPRCPVQMSPVSRRSSGREARQASTLKRHVGGHRSIGRQNGLYTEDEDRKLIAVTITRWKGSSGAVNDNESINAFVLPDITDGKCVWKKIDTHRWNPTSGDASAKEPATGAMDRTNSEIK